MKILKRFLNNLIPKHFLNNSKGHLVAIEDEETNDFLIETFTLETLYLTGAKYTVDGWKWLKENENNKKIEFTNWSEGEPDNLHEKCIVFDKNGWRDTSCDLSYYFICQMDLN